MKHLPVVWLEINFALKEMLQQDIHLLLVRGSG